MTGRPADHCVTIHGVTMTLQQASKLTGVSVSALWREAINNDDLTAYLELRRAGPATSRKVRKPMPPSAGMRARARELAALPDCAVSADCLYMRLRRGWPEEVAVLCAAGVW